MKEITLSELTAFMRTELAKLLSMPVDKIDENAPFDKFGLDSARSVLMVGKLEDYLDIELPAKLLWDYNNIKALSEHLYQAGSQYE